MQKSRETRVPAATRVLSPNGRGGWTPLRPLRGLQEPRVATREESGVLGFPSRCNAGDRGSIPGLGRPPGEGKGNPLQYSCLYGNIKRQHVDGTREKSPTPWRSPIPQNSASFWLSPPASLPTESPPLCLFATWRWIPGQLSSTRWRPLGVFLGPLLPTEPFFSTFLLTPPDLTG